MHLTFRHLTTRIPLLSLLLLALFAAACDSNPVEEDHDDHAEVEGMILTADGTELYHARGTESSGRITVAAGSTTDLITVQFLDHDGDPIHTEDLDAGFSFGWEVTGADLIDVVPEAGGAYAFRLQGRTAGSTTLKVGLKHAGEHFDFSREVPVDVTE